MSGSPSRDSKAARLRGHGRAILGSAGCLLAVTAAIYLFREAVPVLSLGALYLFAYRSLSCGAGHTQSQSR
jgi:hypothetical protein